MRKRSLGTNERSSTVFSIIIKIRKTIQHRFRELYQNREKNARKELEDLNADCSATTYELCDYKNLRGKCFLSVTAQQPT